MFLRDEGPPTPRDGTRALPGGGGPARPVATGGPARREQRLARGRAQPAPRPPLPYPHLDMLHIYTWIWQRGPARAILGVWAGETRRPPAGPRHGPQDEEERPMKKQAEKKASKKTTKKEDEAAVLAAMEAEAKKEDEEETPRGMASTLSKYRAGYADAVSSNGRKSKKCGDEVSNLLEARTPRDVLIAAEILLGLEENELVARYAKLNPGQQRMNGGNRIRAAIKRGDVTIDDLTKVLH